MHLAHVRATQWLKRLKGLAKEATYFTLLRYNYSVPDSQIRQGLSIVYW